MGVDNRTIADGLAVGRASGFVGQVMMPFMSGCYSLEDRRMYRMLAQIADTEGLKLEPSALAGMYGPAVVQQHPAFREFRDLHRATHLVWATGGSMVPEEELRAYYEMGKKNQKN